MHYKQFEIFNDVELKDFCTKMKFKGRSLPKNKDERIKFIMSQQ